MKSSAVGLAMLQLLLTSTAKMVLGLTMGERSGVEMEQIAKMQMQAEILLNLSNLVDLNDRAYGLVQRWCNATENNENDRQRHLERLGDDSKVPELEQSTAREARAAELSFSKLATSACSIRQHEMEQGLRQDLAAIQLRAQGAFRNAAGRQGVTLHGDDSDDDTVESVHESAPDDTDASTSRDVDEGLEKSQDDGKTSSQKELPSVSAAVEEHEKAGKDEDDDQSDDEEQSSSGRQVAAEAGAIGNAAPTSFLQLSLSMMSLSQMFNLLKSKQLDPKKTHKLCAFFQKQGKEKTWGGPLDKAQKNLKTETRKLEEIKLLQLNQTKALKLQARFAKFWHSDARHLDSLLQELDHSSRTWAASTHHLHGVMDRRDIKAARARFGKVSDGLRVALVMRHQNIKHQGSKISVLRAAMKNARKQRKIHQASFQKAEVKMHKVQDQVNHILSACSEMQKQGGKLLLKGIHYSSEHHE